MSLFSELVHSERVGHMERVMEMSVELVIGVNSHLRLSLVWNLLNCRNFLLSWHKNIQYLALNFSHVFYLRKDSVEININSIFNGTAGVQKHLHFIIGSFLSESFPYILEENGLALPLHFCHHKLISSSDFQHRFLGNVSASPLRCVFGI